MAIPITIVMTTVMEIDYENCQNWRKSRVGCDGTCNMMIFVKFAVNIVITFRCAYHDDCHDIGTFFTTIIVTFSPIATYPDQARVTILLVEAYSCFLLPTPTTEEE